MPDVRHDIARVTLAVLFIAALIAASLMILYPFLPPIIWAATLVIATWPLMRRVQRRLWNSRALAVAVMTLALLLVFIVPAWLAIATIVQDSDKIVGWAETIATTRLPTPPIWLGDFPLLGQKLVAGWHRFQDSGVRKLLEEAVPYAGAITQWFIAAVGSFGILLLQLLLTVAFAAIMYAKGELAAAAAIQFGVRLAGERGDQSVRLAAQAIRGVALAVVVTAFVQSAIGGMGLILAGVPFASILCAVMFILCLAQMGPALVLIPAVIWMFMRQDPSWALLLLAFSVVSIGVDNILRPILIRRGADLPLLLILGGVIGGLMAFGLIGIFLGPTVLAVGYKLLGAWISEADVRLSAKGAVADPSMPREPELASHAAPEGLLVKRGFPAPFGPSR
jgi:predicted PurR-regulated permease PerM